MFLNFFSKTEAGHVLKMFLQFWLISASRSYKLGSYEKKKNMYLATMRPLCGFLCKKEEDEDLQLKTNLSFLPRR